MFYKYLRFVILFIIPFPCTENLQLCTAQQSNIIKDIKEIKLNIKSDQQFPLRDIRVVYWPIDSPGEKKDAKLIAPNQFLIKISYEYMDYDEWKYEITEPNHQKTSGTFYYGSPPIDVKLIHNNYYQNYGIDSTQLIEKFGEHSLWFDNMEPKPFTKLEGFFVNINLPVPKKNITMKINGKMDTSYEKYTSISTFSIRKKLYKELIRELILQPQISENELFQFKIKEWIDSNYSNFKKKTLTEFLSFSDNLSASFGPNFSEKLESLFKLISSAEISYSLVEAHKQGLLQSLITAIAYQSFQKDNLDLIQKYFNKSKLKSDKAFTESLNEIRDDLNIEQTNDITELVERMKIKYSHGELSREIVGFMLPKGLASGTEKFSNMGMDGINKKIVGLKISNIKYPTDDKILNLQEWELMINLMMILSLFDRYILNEFYDNYRASVSDLVPEYFYGSLMRIYSGYIFNNLRKRIFNVRNFNVESIKSQYKSGIKKVSEEKENKAKSDYYSLSKLFPKKSPFAPPKRIPNYIENKIGYKSLIAIIIILIVLVLFFIFITRIGTKKIELHTISLTDLSSHKIYTFRKDLITIGRSKSNLIVISDPYIGKEHALIKFDEIENSYIIIDKNSKNGTYVNNVRIHEITLNNGDEIKIGNHSLKVNF